MMTKNGNHLELTADVVNLLDSLNDGLHRPDVGRGNDPHSKSEEKHWATAYALIASSVLRNGSTMTKLAVTNEGAYSIEWLLNNCGCISTDLPVWSLPYARKIWMDEQPCQPGTGFMVPTAHVIQTLCEYAEINGPLKQSCRDAACLAMAAVIDNCSTVVENGRIFWYSTLEAHSYHVLNAVSLMAGEAQRVARLSGREDFAVAADQAVRYVLCQKENDNGTSTWNYFGTYIPENKTHKRNDILHEAFVCQGLLNYKLNGGNLADQIEVPELVGALAKFHRNGKSYDFPESEYNERRRSQPARAIGLAQAIYVLGELHRLEEQPFIIELIEKFIATIREDILVDGKIYYRPQGEDISSYIRTRAHLILGLSQVLQQLIGIKDDIN